MGVCPPHATSAPLTVNIWSISSFKEVLLMVDFGVFAQRTLVGKGEDLLQDIHLPQDLTQAVNPHGFLVLHDGFLQMRFACKGAERSEPKRSRAVPSRLPTDDSSSQGCATPT